MPFKAGQEEDGFLKQLDINKTDLEPIANNGTKVGSVIDILFLLLPGMPVVAVIGFVVAAGGGGGGVATPSRVQY